MALFQRLEKRAGQRARGIVADRLRAVEVAFAAIPGLRWRQEGDALTIEAIGLARRWLDDARLRFALWRAG